MLNTHWTLKHAYIYAPTFFYSNVYDTKEDKFSYELRKNKYNAKKIFHECNQNKSTEMGTWSRINI